MWRAAEVRRTLKRVPEDIEIFDSIFDKMKDSKDDAQREKLDHDLYLQIKKLGRLRDRIKTWLSLGQQMDQTELILNRQNIERVWCILCSYRHIALTSSVSE